MRKATGKGLIEFWQQPFLEGVLPVKTRADIRTACREVLGADQDGPGRDLRTYPLELILETFEAMRPHYPATTVVAYKSRFRRAARIYVAYLDDPEGWQAEVGRRTRTPASGRWQNLAFPLRRDVTVQLRLPADLTRQEAKRLAAYLQAIVP
jgi:hypothetical protein